MNKILLGSDDKKPVSDVGSVINDVLSDKPDFLTRNGTFLLLFLTILLGILAAQVKYPTFHSCTGVMIKNDMNGQYLLYFDDNCKNLNSTLTDKQVNIFKDAAQTIRINAEIQKINIVNNRLVATLYSANNKLSDKHKTLKVYLTVRTNTQSLLTAFLATLKYNLQQKK
ncbi:hypothetical protein Lbys_1378 [Leadbetterella byssophila DSM 17132]|uniref:Uncharacterized protein n=1 Tax=Leadbetterella byssophila (strain DSM 17132 / JCM 16389 / KACC 11308 / NBRC 106382 / 4M15) TaxID=649349 RepID=E4RW61_LEAB4|nr:hypothetical protein [Leadbetterella byssophila]ADQ17096.1 hypothetical protein Lbys_1378 [Leadbetterella byssophila DSM 17132]